MADNAFATTASLLALFNSFARVFFDRGVMLLKLKKKSLGAAEV